MTREDLAQAIAAAVAELKANQERAIPAVADEFPELRSELGRRFAEIDRRFDSLDRRVDRISEGLHAVEARMAGLSKWADTLDRDNTAGAATQAAQQRAIDQLAARVARIERELHPGQ